MMIALPNKDCSWTVTLFMPEQKFKELTSASDVVRFFKQHFPDYIQLIGEEQLVKMYFSGQPQPLVMVKVRTSLSPLWDEIRLLLLLLLLLLVLSVIVGSSRLPRT